MWCCSLSVAGLVWFGSNHWTYCSVVFCLWQDSCGLAVTAGSGGGLSVVLFSVCGRTRVVWQ